MNELQKIRNKNMVMRLMQLVFTLGKDERDPVICRGISILKNLPDDTEVRIESDKISFTLETKKTINGMRTFISLIEASDESYITHLLDKITIDAIAAGELPPVAEGVSDAVIESYESLGGSKTIGSDEKAAIILPLSR